MVRSKHIDVHHNHLVRERAARGEVELGDCTREGMVRDARADTQALAGRYRRGQVRELAIARRWDSLRVQPASATLASMGDGRSTAARGEGRGALKDAQAV
jgi:hypothetical protein